MRDRLLQCLIYGVLTFPSMVVSADDGAPVSTDTASLRITFTVPERIQAAPKLTNVDREASSVCLTTRGSSAFAVKALIQEGVDWQLAPVSITKDASVADCGDDLSLRLDLNAAWYGENGMMTLLVSPL